ncbi:methyltransferase (TIGR00027 family) [Actinoplanes tereljensis]|uniref:S-adenosyl-L-methionine-dependent methyltransferase n=1 Tax=Paractinoplanes tereljensis TaxID=571912 RepID=A0A919NQE1_9ACTN|nr:class I SAM-dependent methyltransferase [Actinoplanes tereljensis]GIF22166.1 SAM-dependent methyltransferase [Actinoplanes tereljensis]
MQNKASRTAQQVALFRALETARGHDRVFDDPLAVRFLGGGYRLLARAAKVRPVGLRLSRFIDTRWPGPRPSAVARTRLIDDLVLESLGGGARQVLLLGAGYDSRAYRLPGIERVAVFEADHPATQAVKRRLIRGAVRPERRRHVHFVPVDLLVEDLGEALQRNGFAALEPTVVVWEGVTNYLTEPAVDQTLRRLADLTATGSRLILTYVDRRVLDGVIDAGPWPEAVKRQGEPWTFGFEPARLGGYLAERGLRLELDMSTRDAADRYLEPLGRHEQAATFYRVAAAEIQ